MRREAERQGLIFALTGLYIKKFGYTPEAVSRAKEDIKEVRQKIEEMKKEKQEEYSDREILEALE